MRGIKFDFGEPFLERFRFGLSIDRVDYDKQKIDLKCVVMDKTFCLFELPKLGIKNTTPIMSEKNYSAKEWLKLYVNKISHQYISNWEQQPDELRLMCGGDYPSWQDLHPTP